MIPRSKGEREVRVEHYRKLGIPKTIKRLDKQKEKGIKAWVEANVEVSTRMVTPKKC